MLASSKCTRPWRTTSRSCLPRSRRGSSWAIVVEHGTPLSPRHALERPRIMHLRWLSDLRVLDMSQYLPGPFAARLLADMGADVVKVEPPGGEPGRHFDLEGKPGVSPFWRVLNSGKTVITLDLKFDEGRQALSALIAVADVLLESYRPGVLDRLGFGNAALRELKPSLVHC